MKITLKQGLVWGGATIAIISALALISQHPIIIIIMGIGVCAYLQGKKEDKK